MKKIIFVAVVLAMTMGISSSTQAFWGFSKKANKAEIKNEQAESNSAAVGALIAFTGESDIAKIAIMKTGGEFKSIAGGAVVKSNTAGVLETEITFGLSKVNLTLKTNAETKVYRAYDGKSDLFGVSNIVAGDNLSVEGVLDITTTALTITAKKIKNFSAQSKDVDYNGKITEIDAPKKTFNLDIVGDKDLTVFVNDGTIIYRLVKDSRGKIAFSDLLVDDVVKIAKGVVGAQGTQLIAREIVVTERSIGKKIDNVFATVVSVDGSTSMTVKTTTNVVYTVSFVNSGTSYYKWTVSKKFSGKKNGTDGVSTTSTLDGLAIKAEDKVWVTGTVEITTNKVKPTSISKDFYR